MKRIIAKLTTGALVIMLAVVGCQNVTDVSNEDLPNQGDVIDGQYIVVMKNSNTGKFKIGNELQVEEIRSQVMQRAGIGKDLVLNSYNNTIAGFSAQLNSDQLNKLRADENVDYVEEDRIVVLRHHVELQMVVHVMMMEMMMEEIPPRKPLMELLALMVEQPIREVL